jgi:signal transduction histidine kinase
MAGANGSKGSVYGGLVVLGLLLWGFSFIARHWWTILSYAAIGAGIGCVAVILWGYLAGAPAGDRNDRDRALIRRNCIWLGTIVWGIIAVATAFLAAAPFGIRIDGDPFWPILSGFVVVLAFVHLVSWLLGRLFAAFVRPHFLTPLLQARSANFQRRFTEAPRHHAETTGEQASSAQPDPDELRRREEARRRLQEEEERRRVEEEIRRRAEEEHRRRQAEDERRARSRGLAITTVPDALDYLEMSKPFTGKELDRKRKAALMRAHPDHGGTNAMARLVNEAYEILKPLAR